MQKKIRKNIAIIPARAGSNRIPNKNIKMFFGKPILAWTIINLKKSKLFKDIYVSTDSKKIANIAKKYGAKVPFYRSKKLSGNFTGTQKVVQNMINFLTKNGAEMSYVCCVYPTACNIRPKDVKKGFYKIKKKWDFVISASQYESPPQRAFVKKNNALKMIYPKLFNCRTQDLQPMFFDAGQFYWAKTQTWLNKKLIFNKSCTTVFIPRWRVQDIDTMEDWKKAQLIFKIMKGK